MCEFEAKRKSESVVFPWSTCAMMQMFRMALGAAVFTNSTAFSRKWVDDILRERYANLYLNAAYARKRVEQKTFSF